MNDRFIADDLLIAAKEYATQPQTRVHAARAAYNTYFLTNNTDDRIKAFSIWKECVETDTSPEMNAHLEDVLRCVEKDSLFWNQIMRIRFHAHQTCQILPNAYDCH